MSLKCVERKMISQSITILFIFYIICPNLSAQEIGQWQTGFNIDYSQPVGGLANWFKFAPGYSVSIGNQYNAKWFLEGTLEYSNFDKENTGGYIDDHVELSLEHIGLVVNGKYDIIQLKPMTIVINVGAGLYSWRGIRGEVEADSTMIPYVPFIERKTLNEINWGLRSGIGVEFNPFPSMSIEFLAYYRFIVGDLWPTLQPHIELEGVSGFQTINFSVGMRFYF